MEMGRLPEAVTIMDRAVALNPLSADVEATYGQILFLAHKYDEARPHLLRALELEPKQFNALRILSNLREVTGDLEGASEVLRRAVPLIGLTMETSAQGGRIYAKQGRRADALRVLSNVTKPGMNPNRQSLATLYFALGDKDNGFKTLTKDFDQKINAELVKVDPLFDDVRDDPRMKGLIARLKLPDSR
jgi:predicted Zn-dependent protease